MVSDFGTSRYCNKCDGEIVRKGDVITMYHGKKICKCKKFEAVSVEEKKSIKKIEKAFEEIRKDPKIIKNIEKFLLKTSKKGCGK